MSAQIDIDDGRLYHCDGCGDALYIQDTAYHGPADPLDISCDPFQIFLTLCPTCVVGTQYDNPGLSANGE